MKSKLLAAHGEKTFAVVFATGDEAADGLLAFAKREHLAGSHFTGIGAFQSVVLGYFDWHTKQYQKIAIDEQVEVLSLVGDIALSNGEPKIHAHVVVGKADGSAHGGHLLKARVRPTLEVILTESPGHMQRHLDPESGLALIQL